MLEIFYRPRSTLSVTRRVWHQRSNTVTSSEVILSSTSLSAYLGHSSGPTYYWDDASGSVFFAYKKYRNVNFSCWNVSFMFHIPV